VLVNAAVDGIGFPTVATDDGHAVEQAYGHLTSLGHERIGLILGPADHVPSARKLTAFATALEPAGLAEEARIGRWVERTIFSMEGGHAAAGRLISRGVTGIICASDVLALGAIRAARRARLRVPDDVSVVGYDDSAFMTCTEPPLTTVRQPIEAMGQAVVALLVSEVAGNAVPADELVFEPELVVRGSTGPAAVAAAPRQRRASGATR
jgi:DNA-binding LacI/PurR family transcriptional regulator